MQVNLDDSTNLQIAKIKDKEDYVFSIDGRIKLRFSRSELKYIQAMIDAALKDDAEQSRDSLKNSIKDAVLRHKGQLQNILRNVRTEDIAYAVWFAGDETVKNDILSNMSKRASDDVVETIKEGIERRIRKERAEGNADIEDIMLEQGRSAAAILLKRVLDS
ncbi:MAG: hypothetical protein C0602_10240 [Denitrovibrio sp.]|nr:MAG: hypothetical protein C0602_10240 [Denitrovibrio sp.]